MFALRVRIDHVDGIAGNRRARHLGAQLDVQTLLLEVPLRLLGDGLIHHRQKLIQGFEHGDLAAEAPPDAAEFQTDHACADDAETLRHRVELQRIPGIDDVLAVVRHGPQPNRDRSRCQDHVLGFERLLGAVRTFDDDFVSGQQAAVSLNADHAVGLEQRIDPVGHGLDHGGAALLHRRKIELQVADLDAVNRKLIFGALKELG